MRLRSYLTLSVVACNLLVGANYTNWATANFNDGDTIDINYDAVPPPPRPQVLTQGITISGGNATATIRGNFLVAGTGATIGVFGAGNTTFGGNGTINFNILTPLALPAFKAQNTTLKITSGFTLKGATTAFDVSGGSFTLATNGNQKVDIQGGLNFQNGVNTKITLKTNNQSITGNITANASPTEINLQNGGKITGSFTGSGNGNQFTLKVDGANSLFKGDMSNNGTANITISNGGKVQGNFTGTAAGQNNINLTINQDGTFQGNINNVGHTIIKNTKGTLEGNITARGNQFKMELDGGKFTGTANISGKNVNEVTAKGDSVITGGINTDTNATITLQDNSIIKTGTSSFKVKTDLTFKGSSKAQNTSFTIQQGTSTIQFQDQSSLNSSVINTNGGMSNITFSNNAKSEQGSQISVNNNATSNLTIKDSAKINGTTILTQGGIHNIIFKDNAGSDGSKIQVTNGTANLTVKGQAHLKNTTIQTTGGQHEIKFQESAKVTNGTFLFQGGTTNLEAKDQTEISANLTQNGGTSKVELKDSAKWSGNITLNNGTTKIDFKNNAQMVGKISQTNGASTIKFDHTTKITGDIEVKGGTTDITFTGQNAGTKDNTTNAQIIGNITAAGSNNKVTFTAGTKLKGNLTLDGYGVTVNGQSVANIKGARITGFIQGWDEVDLVLQDSQVDGALKQGGSFSQKALKATIKGSTISGGFEGKGGSNNDIEITDSIIKGGIKQNTGSLKLFSTNTKFFGGFSGNNSNNSLQIANGNFNNGDFTQNGGSLKAELVNLQNVENFTGTNSSNVIHATRTELNNITQSGGSLNFRTDSEVKGSITGNNNSQNKISVTGANIGGNLSQTTGSMEAILSNGNVKNIQATGANFSLHTTNYNAQKIDFTNSNVSGSSSNLTLTGTFTQTGGNSNISFADSKFQSNIILDNTQSASLIFTKSDIKEVQATGGNNTLNLSDGKMQNFSGDGGHQGITMTNSKAQNFNQNNGSLTLNASSGSEIKEVKSQSANLTISLGSQSKVINNIENNGGNTTLSLQDAEVGGDIKQTGRFMILNASNSTIKGQYSHNGGVSTTNLTNSKIEGGVKFENLAAGTLTLNQNSEIKNLKSNNSIFDLNLRNESSIKEGINQTAGKITGAINSKSEIKQGLTLTNGTTTLSLYGKSKISGDITATNNQTTLLVDDSSIDGNMTIKQGFLHLTAQNKSTINSPQLTLTNADLKLILDTQSKFIGDLSQTNNKQDILIKQDSEFQGNITNTNTTGSISINHSKLTGNLSQTGGNLKLDLSNEGKIEGNINLTNATTTLSGTGQNNEIKGNFTQSNGDLSGSMTGLTLKGTYSQNGGNSSVTFIKSSFTQDTNIENANKSSLTFIQSTLKGYTTEGGDNTLKLLDQTKMTGDLTLKNNAQTFLKMDQSRLEGGINGSNNSTLTLDLLKSTITGKIEINTGGLKGSAQESIIQGDIELKNTNSQVSFNKSAIEGDFKVKGGDVKLDLSNGSVLQKNLLISDKAIFHLTGSPANNKIQGDFKSEESTLTGDISSLTLEGKFIQNQGTSKITFRDESILNGEVTITKATSSHLELINKSGIQNKISITDGNDNKLTLKDQSFIKGDITTTNSKLTISANQSSILGKITANDAQETDITLDHSTLKGNITQTQGIFKLKAQNQSILQSSLTLTNTNQASIELLSQSSLVGKINATNSDLTINLSSASFNTLKAPQEVKITNGSLTLQASEQSLFAGNLTQTSDTGNHTSTLNFLKSLYAGTMDFTKVKTTAIFTQSKILSDSIKVKNGSFDLTFDDSKEGGVIKAFEGEETTISILAKGESSLKILEASITNSTLSLKAQDSSRLTIDSLQLDGGTKATYEALTNGNLNVNTLIKDNASTLSVNLHGGILQGTIIQGHINTGDVTLREDGGFGGRWGITGDSQIKSLTINNDAQVFEDGVSIFSSIVKNRLSFVDFTMEFSDETKSSRMGKAIIAKPQPGPNGIIPPPPANQTYARVLKTQSLSGNGLFRVYADLGSKMADRIEADKASGSHIIQVYYRAETFREIGKDRIVVAKVSDPNTTASFKGTQSDVGLTRYNTEIIKQNAQNGTGFEWIIGQATPAGLSYASKIIASILQSQYRLFSIETDSLDRRLGGLEKIQRDKGFWVRSFFGQASKKALSYSIDEKDTYYSFWSGFDYNSIGLTGHNFLGLFFNYTGMNTESAAYLGKSSSFGFGFYDVFKAYSGFYFDVLFKYIYSMSSFDISSYALSKNKPEINNHKFLANLEIGYTFYLGEKHKSLYIQPQFQITGGYIQGYSTHFIDVSGENIQASIGHNAPAILRLGAFVGKTFGENIRLNIKGGSSFAYDVNSGGELKFKDSSNAFQTYQKGDFRMLLSAHADLILSDSFRLYSSFDTSFFGTYNTIFNLNVGLRLTFGKRNNVVADVPMVYNPYQPPQPQPTQFDQRTIPVVKTYTTKDIDSNYIGKNRGISSFIPGNPSVTPVNGYAPQPITRRSYRDQSIEVNPNLKGNQQ